MRIGSLFSGVGGLELGLEQAGLGPTIWQCEEDTYCRSVLSKRWPGIPVYPDVRGIDESVERPDLLCGGFPCQDISTAGKGAGLAGKRSGLWFEFARIVALLSPDWVVVENAASGATRWVGPVCGQLERLGYDTLPLPISAGFIGAPHRRARIFVVASNTVRGAVRQQYWREDQKRKGSVQPSNYGQVRSMARPTEPDWRTEPGVGRVANGVPAGVDRLRTLGNAVVPPCAEIVGHVIRELCER